MGSQMVGAVALNVVRSFLNSQKSIKPKVESQSLNKNSDLKDLWLDGPSTQIEGYVRFNIFFLKANDQALKIQIFKQKNQILEEVNLALEKVGYKTRVVEIRIKN